MPAAIPRGKQPPVIPVARSILSEVTLLVRTWDLLVKKTHSSGTEAVNSNKGDAAAWRAHPHYVGTLLTGFRPAMAHRQESGIRTQSFVLEVIYLLGHLGG